MVSKAPARVGAGPGAGAEVMVLSVPESTGAGVVVMTGAGVAPPATGGFVGPGDAGVVPEAVGGEGVDGALPETEDLDLEPDLDFDLLLEPDLLPLDDLEDVILIDLLPLILFLEPLLEPEPEPLFDPLIDDIPDPDIPDPDIPDPDIIVPELLLVILIADMVCKRLSESLHRSRPRTCLAATVLRLARRNNAPITL